MAKQLFEIFTDVEVLKSREPEYFICKEPITVDLDELFGNKPCLEAAKDSGKSMNSSEQTKEGVQAAIPAVATATTPAKTFVSILEEGCKKYYSGAPPVFTSDLSEMTDLFVIRCELYGTSTLGRGRTKKSAKQMAAKEMLHKLVEKESFKEFGLGKTKEEALASLESMMSDFQKAEDTDGSMTENWVGKVNERCQKLKLQNPVYEIDEEGPPNQRIFIATCRIGNAEATAHGKTKKIAKTLAAQKMYSKLDNYDDLEGAIIENTVLPSAGQEVEEKAANENNVDKSTSKDEQIPDEPIESVEHLESVMKIRAAFRSGFSAHGLADRLHDLIHSGDENINKVFSEQELKYVFFVPDINGEIQCLLSLDGPNGMKNAFYGFGSTETAAKDYAARNALVHLELFVGTADPSAKGPSDPSESKSKEVLSTNTETDRKEPLAQKQ